MEQTTSHADVLNELRHLQEQVYNLSEHTLLGSAQSVLQHLPSTAGRAWWLLQGCMWTVILAGVGLYCWWSRSVWLRSKLLAASAAEKLAELSKEELVKLLGPGNIPAWLGTPDWVRVKWLNEAMAQLWPSLQEVLNRRFHELLDPLIEESKPRWVHHVSIMRFEVGDKPPEIRGVKVYHDTGSPSHLVLEFDFYWVGKQEVKMLIKPLPPNLGKYAPPGLARGLSRLLSAKVVIQDLVAEGRLRAAMEPLLGAEQIAAVMQVSLVDMPEYSFALHAYGGDVTYLPGVEAWMSWFVHKRVLTPFVLPERLSLPINFLWDERIKAKAESNWLHHPKGMLFITVVEATNVPRMDWFGLKRSDPFVKLHVREANKLKTSVKKTTKHPVWNEDFRLLVHVPESQYLNATLYDWDRMSAADVVGTVGVPIRDLVPGKATDLWLPVLPEHTEQHVRNSSQQEASRGQEPTAAPEPTLASVARFSRVTKLVDNAKSGLGQLGIDTDFTCKLHLKCTYHAFGTRELKTFVEGRHMHPEDQPAHALQHQGSGTDVSNYLRGGIVYVRLRAVESLAHKNWIKRAGLRPALRAKVDVAGIRKKSAWAQIHGSEAVWDETLEFVTSGDMLAQEGSSISIEIWDYRMHNQCMGRFAFPLAKLVEDRNVRDTFTLEAAKHGRLSLDLKFLSVLEGS